MAQVNLVNNDHGRSMYWCGHCECTYGYSEPMSGTWHVFSGINHYSDDDGDIFIPEGSGEVQTIVGWGCHHDDGPCYLLSDTDWQVVHCQAWQCEGCGQKYTFDNDYCSDHTYSIEDEAKECAENCCSGSEASKTEEEDLKDMDPQLLMQILKNGKVPSEAHKDPVTAKEPDWAKLLMQIAPDPMTGSTSTTTNFNVTSVNLTTGSGATFTTSFNVSISEA